MSDDLLKYYDLAELYAMRMNALYQGYAYESVTVKQLNDEIGRRLGKRYRIGKRIDVDHTLGYPISGVAENESGIYNWEQDGE